MSELLREDKSDKPDFTIIPYVALVRLAERFTLGAKKYDRDNYKHASIEEIQSYRESALRHLYQYVDGQDDEPHLDAAMCNIAIVMFLEGKHGVR
jgi:hypothetical protein